MSNENDHCLDNDFYNTIIIGAGLAGASTAYHLLCENNYKGKVLILEARNRIGGRIHGQTIAGKHVELGANWIHGIINNPIYELAKKYNLIDPIKDKPDEDPYSSSGNVCGFTHEGEKVPITLISSAYQVYFWILKRGEDFYRRMCKGEIIAECSLGHYVETEITNYLLTKNEKERPLLRSIFNHMISRETDINGANDLYDISLRYYGLYVELAGGNLVIPKGFGLVVQGLIDDILIKTQGDNKADHFKLLLNHKVTKIKWCGVESKSKEPVNVFCENGKIFKCNHLVNTMPLGVLKDHIKTLYLPAVPQYKIDCVNALNFDYVNKIYLEYEESLSSKFIDPSVNEIMVFFLLSEEEEREVKKQVNLEKHWIKKIYAFTKVNERLLLAWLSGKEAQYAEKLNDEVIGKELTNLLRQIYRNPEFPLPSKVVATHWGSDEFTRGSYSNLKVGSTGEDIEKLGQPIYSDPGNDKPVLLFAGESTHPIYFSTTHGAFLSGKKAASYLLDQ